MERVPIRRQGALLAGIIALMLVAMLALIGCGSGASSSNATDSTGSPASESPGTRTVTDLSGNVVTLPEDVTKVATLCGPSLETAIMLNQTDKVVYTGNKGGQGAWAKIVDPAAAEIPVTDDATHPNVEALLDAGVQVVLYWDAYPDVTKELEDAGIAVVVTQENAPDIHTSEEFLKYKEKEITLVGDVFGGDAVDKAAAWCDYAEKTYGSIIGKTKDLADRPTVYYVRGPKALTIHGGNSYTRYLVDMAGGDLVSKDDAELMYDTTMEQVLNWDPEYIFMGRVNNTDLIIDDPAWENIKAVKDGHVYVNEKGVFVPDYSTDCFLLAEQIAKTLHPDAFADLDLTKSVKDYYHDFYNYDLTDDQANRILNSQDPA